MRNVALLTVAVGCLLVCLTIRPSTAHAGKASMDARERAVVRSINRQRAHYGLRHIRGNAGLARAASFHSWEMLAGNYFDHNSRDGGSFDQRVRRFAPRRAVGETIAMVGGGCRRGMAGHVVSMWMNSPGHRAILLSSGFRLVGIGARGGSLSGGHACVVTADFASRR
jgi:uncharacterized protein YkwD